LKTKLPAYHRKLSLQYINVEKDLRLLQIMTIVIFFTVEKSFLRLIAIIVTLVTGL